MLAPPNHEVLATWSDYTFYIGILLQEPKARLQVLRSTRAYCSRVRYKGNPSDPGGAQRNGFRPAISRAIEKFLSVPEAIESLGKHYIMTRRDAMRKDRVVAF